MQVLTGGKERPDVLGQALRDKNRHWDFLIKEMMWMADDFQQERKRHMVSPGSRLAGLSAIEAVIQQTASAGTFGKRPPLLRPRVPTRRFLHRYRC